MKWVYTEIEPTSYEGGQIRSQYHKGILCQSVWKMKGGNIYIGPVFIRQRTSSQEPCCNGPLSCDFSTILTSRDYSWPKRLLTDCQRKQNKEKYLVWKTVRRFRRPCNRTELWQARLAPLCLWEVHPTLRPTRLPRRDFPVVAAWLGPWLETTYSISVPMPYRYWNFYNNKYVKSCLKICTFRAINILFKKNFFCKVK